MNPPAPNAPATEPDPGPAGNTTSGPGAATLWPGAPVTPPGAARVPRLPPGVWQALLEHEPTVRRYRARVYQRGTAQCWPWLGAISDTGHGKLRAGTRAPGGPPSRVVTAHVYGWQLVYGLITLPPGTELVIAHRCDESGCQNPAHWYQATPAGNTADYLARRHRRTGPLADVRGAAGRARAVAAAIRTAIAAGTNPETALRRAQDAGIPGEQATLF